MKWWKIPNILWFQGLKQEDVLLFFTGHNWNLEICWFLDETKPHVLLEVVTVIYSLFYCFKLQP